MNLPANELMKRQLQQHRQSLLRMIGVILVTILVIYFTNHGWRPKTKPSEYKVGDWVYLQAPEVAEQGKPEPKVLVPADTTKGQADPKLKEYLGRPGKIRSVLQDGIFHIDFDLQTEERKLFNTPEETRLVTQSWAVPMAWLRRCPPGQGDVNSSFAGVIRAWNATDPEFRKTQALHEGKIGDKVLVEVKDFDRWIFRQMDFGRLKEDINEAPPEFRKFVDKIVAARRSVDFFQALNHANQLLHKELLDPATSEQAWKTLERMIKENSVLSDIVAEKADGQLQTIDWEAKNDGTDKARDRELRKVQERIGPLKVWMMTITQKRFSQLTLVLNGIVLPGLTPRNVYNDAEVMHDVRPSFRDETIQWIAYELERRQVRGEPGEANAEDAANAAAWSRLLGRPKLREAVKVTLVLPESGLELQTKVTPESVTEATRFDLIGIRAEVLYATLAVFVCLLGFLSWLARTTDILRDSSGPIRPDGLEPVSLAKTQMAFWFILTASAFAFLWVTTGNHDTINKTCLVLLGIGTGTALGAALIPSLTGGAREAGKNTRNYLVETSLLHTREEVAAEIRAAIIERARLLWLQTGDADTSQRQALLGLLRKVASKEQFADFTKDLGIPAEDAGEADPRSNAAIAGIVTHVAKDLRSPAPGAAMERLLDELDLLAKQMKDFQAMQRTALRRLFSDLLNEDPAGGSYEFHRFQMLSWTLLLGLVFLVKLLNDRTMPEFGDTTLILLGISGGTYLGFKIPAVKGTDRRSDEGTG